jgi:hypothetical protein
MTELWVERTGIRRYTGRTPTQLRARTPSTGLLNPSGHGHSASILRVDKPIEPA